MQRRARRQWWRGDASTRKHARDSEILSRMGKRRLRTDGWNRHIRNRPGRKRIFYRRRLIARRAANLSRGSQNARAPGPTGQREGRQSTREKQTNPLPFVIVGEGIE